MIMLIALSHGISSAELHDTDMIILGEVLTRTHLGTTGLLTEAARSRPVETRRKKVPS
jgi:hypothetical protein